LGPEADLLTLKNVLPGETAATGRVMQRVQVVTEPLSLYPRSEIG
jgi:hypothetical protein